MFFNSGKEQTLQIDKPLACFIRLNQVLELIPVSKATWWNGCKTGRFPKPYKIAPRITAWNVQEIIDCLNEFKRIN